jgi:hypothetical protein
MEEPNWPAAGVHGRGGVLLSEGAVLWGTPRVLSITVAQSLEPGKRGPVEVTSPFLQSRAGRAAPYEGGW